MMLKYLATFVVLACPAIAVACPDTSGSGPVYNYSSTDLYSAIGIPVRAGGDIDVSNCSMAIVSKEKAYGFVVWAPDVELVYTKNENYDLEFRVNGPCDAVILLNDGANYWFWDDDDGVDNNPAIRISNPSNGTYDIWVGTYDGASCDATLTIETFLP